MRKYSFLLVYLFFTIYAQGQQEVLTSNFMMNKLYYNPGYVVEEKTPVVVAQVRSQWLGVEGAPNMQRIGFSMPLLNNRVGAGMTISNFSAGITSEFTISGLYGYRLRFGRGSSLLMGLNADLSSFSIDYADERLVSIHSLEEDLSIPNGLQSKFLFNVGLGAYFSAEDFYLGFSVPGMIEDNIDFVIDEVGRSFGVRHLYFMGGAEFDLSKKNKIQPNLLFRYVEGAYLNMDINTTVCLDDKVFLGATYRNGGKNFGVGESIDLLLGTYLSDKVMMAVSYDITLSSIRNHSAGSVELLLKYKAIKQDSRKIGNPRFM